MGIITVERKVLRKNDEVAAENRATFENMGLFVVNLLSSPGAGKTTLLEATIRAAEGRMRIGVVEGDVQTDFDAQRIVATGAPAVQIVTNGACHLEAKLVQDAMSQLDLEGLDVLVIENVGNLVCPASFDLGEAKKVVIASTTEGTDKPAKYPKMFRVAHTCVINKMDLTPHLDFDLDRFKAYAREINPELEFIETSAHTGDGVGIWLDWLARHTGR